jgi:type IV secretion system protein VirB4
VVLNKDGSLQRAAEFRGPDLDAATDAQVAAAATRVNGALRRLGQVERPMSGPDVMASIEAV